MLLFCNHLYYEDDDNDEESWQENEEEGEEEDDEIDGVSTIPAASGMKEDDGVDGMHVVVISCASPPPPPIALSVVDDVDTSWMPLSVEATEEEWRGRNVVVVVDDDDDDGGGVGVGACMIVAGNTAEPYSTMGFSCPSMGKWCRE